MELLTIQPNWENPKRVQFAEEFNALLEELYTRPLSDEMHADLREMAKGMNELEEREKGYFQILRQHQKVVVKRLVQEEGWSPMGYFQQLWMAQGMAVFGVALGLCFGVALKNMAFLGIGLPIGMAIGIAIGKKKDEEKKQAGQQLNWEIKKL